MGMMKDGFDVTVISDNMAGWVMKQGKINAVIVGADRIAANGDVANKIGTYMVAVLAKRHGIPFYVAAPTSTIDMSIKSGSEIPIEERSHEEVATCGGKRIVPNNVNIYNPAFDVTDNELVTAIITEKGIIYPPYEENLKKLFEEGNKRLFTESEESDDMIDLKLLRKNPELFYEAIRKEIILLKSLTKLWNLTESGEIT